MTNKTITYYTKSVYGNELIYIADHDAYIEWYNLTGKKTITERDMRLLTNMTGVAFERVFEPAKVAA